METEQQNQINKNQKISIRYKSNPNLHQEAGNLNYFKLPLTSSQQTEQVKPQEHAAKDNQPTQERIVCLQQKSQFEENNIVRMQKQNTQMKNLIQKQDITLKKITSKENQDKNNESLLVSKEQQQILEHKSTSQYKQIGLLTNKIAFPNIQLISLIKVKMSYFFKMFTFSGRKLLLENNKKVRQAINDKCDLGLQPAKQVNCALKRFIRVTDEEILELQHQTEDQYMIPISSFLNIFLLFSFTILNFIILLLLSIMLVYQLPSEQEPQIERIIIIIWILEILVDLNTQMYKKNKLINKRKFIAILYLRKRAAFDFIPIITTIIDPSSEYIHFIMKLITFIKLKNFLIDLHEMQRYLCMTVKNYYVVQLFNLIVKIFLFGHLIASLWYIVGQVELKLLNEETTWYDSSFGADGVWWKLYLESMYWALTLMTAGSNEGNSIIQLIFITIAMLFTAIIFGYMLNTTGTILSQLSQQDENKRIDLNIINDYMRTNKISIRLQNKVNQDLEYYYRNNLKKELEENQQVLKKISPHLNRQLKLEYSRQFLEKFCFLEKKFSKQTLDEVSLELQEEYYPPNQWLFQENQYDDISLMFIEQGSVQLLKSLSTNNQDFKPISQVKKGQVLGSVNFFTGLSYNYGAKSSEITKVVKLRRDKFLEIIQKNKEDSEMFCLMRDQQAIYEEYSISETRCLFCNCTTHLHTDCHLVHVERSEILQKAKMCDKQKQERLNNYKRKNQRSNSYQIQKDIQIQIQKFHWNRKNEEKQLKIQNLKKQLEWDSESFSSDNYSNLIESSSSNESFQEQANILPKYENRKTLYDLSKQQKMNQKNEMDLKELVEDVQQSPVSLYKNSKNEQNDPSDFQNTPYIFDNNQHFYNQNPSVYYLNSNQLSPSKNFIQQQENPFNGNKQRANFSNKDKSDNYRLIMNKNFPQIKNVHNLKDNQKRCKLLETNLNKYYKVQPQQSELIKKLKQQNLAIKLQNLQNQPQIQHNNQVEDLQEKKRILGFDRMREYVLYFPKGNYKNIIQKYYKFIQMKKLKEQQQKNKKDK